MSKQVDVSAAYRIVRDATLCNEDITVGDKIGVLEMVKHEILTDALNAILNAGEDNG